MVSILFSKFRLTNEFSRCYVWLAYFPTNGSQNIGSMFSIIFIASHSYYDRTFAYVDHIFIFFYIYKNKKNERGSLVRAEEQAFRFNNFGSRKAFSIILFVLNRKFFVQSDAPISGIFFLNFSPNSLHLKHC